jgi:hypothetical protein
MVRNALLVGLSAGVIAVGCSLLNPLEGYSGGAADALAPPADVVAQQETSIPDAPTSDAGCVGARPPPRPPASGNLDGGSTTIVAAISSFELGEKSDPKIAKQSGYDLDLLCTCPGPRACVPKSGAGICDLPSGVDNSGGAWLLGLANLQSGVAFGAGASVGAEGILMRIRNYNDLPDDDDVEVALFDTFGAEAFQPDAGGGTLKRDGTDRWTVDAKSLLGGTPYLPVAVDTRAYVRGGVVVAEIRFPFRIGDITFPVSSGYVTASLVKLPTGFYALEKGILSGRLNASEFLTAFEGIASIAPGPGFLCGADPIYASLRESFCRVLDLPTDPTTDGREGPCDAVSLVIGFTAYPSVLGNIVQRPRPPRPCGSDWVGRCP